MTTFWLLVGSVVLVFVNGFFVGAEFSLMASRRTKIEPLAAAGLWRARSARRAMAALPTHLTACTIGVTMASLGLGAVAERALGGLLEGVFGALPIPDGLARGIGFALAFGIVVLAHLVVGELVPKYVALTSPERLLLALVLPFRAVVIVLTPVVWLLAGAARFCVRLVGVEPREELATAASAEDLAVMLAASREEGLIEDTAHGLLTGALEIGDRPVSEVMVPADQVVHVDLSTTAAEAEELAVATGLSRLPVADGTLDRLVGFVHVKDLLAIPASGRERPLPLSRIHRGLLRIEGSRRLDDVLVQMRRERVHIAAVVGAPHAGAANGTGTLGIVSLEDVVEALVGDDPEQSDTGTGRTVSPPA
jgi:CBS domain containing-hemolysin-like protein